MDNKELLNILNIVKNAKRIYRDEAANEILNKPDLLPPLIDKVYDTDDPLHIKAAWILELVALNDILHIDKEIHRFIQGMPKLSHESALRPVSKVCSLWSKYYFSFPLSEDRIDEPEVETIISCNFDWLIEEHKVATQVFAMDTLKLFGSRHSWIKDELRLVLQKNADSGSSGYRAHARKLLKNL